MSSEEIFFKFHSNHADHIILEEECSVAYRTVGYDSGLVFSQKQLQPGEFFVVEIDQNEENWSGYLRLGLTQVNPSIFSSKNVKIPERAVPDLMRFGATWVYGLADLLPNIGDIRETSWPCDIETSKFYICDEYIKTCRGTYSRFNFKSLYSNDKTLDIDTGFKVGIVYVPCDETIADLFYVINGDVLGPYAIEIPYKESPLYAVADIYGKTKKVRLLQIQPETSLKQMCRLIILKTHDMKEVNKLPLPNQIVDYLNFKSDYV